MESRRLLIDGARGIYVPQAFYEGFDFGAWGLNIVDYSALRDPELEEYWETWAELLQNAEHHDDEGNIWRLEQDGDLWAVNVEFDGWEIVSERKLRKVYDDVLDDIYGQVKIGGFKYNTSYVMKLVDKIAYDSGFNDWLDSEIQDNRVKEDSDGNYYIEA